MRSRESILEDSAWNGTSLGSVGGLVNASPWTGDKYQALGTAEYYDQGDKGWWPAVNAIRYRMAEGDLCWTRDWDGNYYLGRVEGAWQYRATPGAH